MEQDKQELLNELAVISTLVDENPCRMPSAILSAIAKSIKTLVGSHISGGASREQAARYLQRDTRTLTRWKNEFPDFPSPRHDGHREISYDWLELIHWKLNHKELYQ